jgi:hypothetical protein
MIRAMIRSFSLVLLLTGGFFSAGLQAAERPPMPHVPMGVANGCFVETAAMLDSWQEKTGAEGWARLLRWGAKEEEEVVAGHAVAVVENAGRLWCWDVNFGWSALTVDAAQRENTATIVEPIVARYAKVKAQYPLYMADFPQPTGAAPARGAQDATDVSLRDVLTVASRLIKHRPVNVVTFTYGPEGERRTSAAAIFIYGGRYWVYVPELGTVPTRARGGVENLRLIQEILRRLCLGANDVRKR